MAGAKKRMLDYLLDHIGEDVNWETLREIAVISDWARSLRLLRQEGYDLETTKTDIFFIPRNLPKLAMSEQLYLRS